MVRRWVQSIGGATGTWLAGLGVALVTVGCEDSDAPRVVALVGCGLEGQELSSLRIRVRGDFPLRQDILVEGGNVTLDPLPSTAAGITVEGRFGDAVLAVGRTARIRDDELPVYYAAPDQLCAVPSTIAFRDVGASGVGVRGDVLLVGGRSTGGALAQQIVHMVDVEGVAEPLQGSLPVPTTGQSVHPLPDGDLLVVGGAGPDAPVFSMVRIDPRAPSSDDPVGDPILIDESADVGRAHHAAGTLGDGGIVIAGGCIDIGGEGNLPGTCRVPGARVLASTLHIDPDTLASAGRPDLGFPRYDAELLVARDGVVFIVGGFDGDGVPVDTIERLSPGAGAWEVFGPDLGPILDDGGERASIAGSTLLEGSLIVMALSDGRLGWVSDQRAGTVPFTLPSAAARRTLTTLPGERVLVDLVLAPLGLLDAGAADVIDVGSAAGLAPRVHSAAVSLDDGTVLLAGGRDPMTGAPAQGPFLLRLRPVLDGPDENVPGIAGPAPLSFVVHDLDAVRKESANLVLDPLGLEEPFPAVRAHIRGFRSASFRLSVTLEVVDDARPHLVLEHGAREATSIRLDPDGVRAWRRSSSGAVSALACEGVVELGASASVTVDVGAEQIRFRTGADIDAACAGAGETAAAVGIGASGTGRIRARNFLLTRV